MIDVKHYGSGEKIRTYQCTTKAAIELCFANIECLLNIALLDSDEHIRELGGEQELLNLMIDTLTWLVVLRTGNVHSIPFDIDYL